MKTNAMGRALMVGFAFVATAIDGLTKAVKENAEATDAVARAIERHGNTAPGDDSNPPSAPPAATP